MDVDLHVAAWRKYRGLTQAELAARVDIHRVALARIEAGAEPKAGTFLGLASELGRPARGCLLSLSLSSSDVALVHLLTCPRAAIGLRPRRRVEEAKNAGTGSW